MHDEATPSPYPRTLKLVDNDDLDAVEEQFRAGVMSLTRHPTTAHVVIEDHHLNEVDEDDEDKDGFLEDDGAAGHTCTPSPIPDAGLTW